MKELCIKFLGNYKDLNINIKKIINKGIGYSFCLIIVSTVVLITYLFFNLTPLYFYIGFCLFKSSLFFIMSFIIFGFAFDKIEKEIT